ncbi:uncharacterized protein LOC143448827 [Clavelina lepadiformis]|uniref:uncharacterized protein LOC143448827 n=1 Tax=Clavelina lepadiformis TaxID=159417 RepID=UPI0040431619
MKLTPLLLYVFVVLRNVNALDPPANVTWTEARSTFFVVTWAVVEDVSYKFFVKLNDESGPPSTPPDNAVDTTSPYNVTHTSSGDSIRPYTLYSFHVYALKGGQNFHADFNGLSTDISLNTLEQLFHYFPFLQDEQDPKFFFIIIS